MVPDSMMVKWITEIAETDAVDGAPAKILALPYYQAVYNIQYWETVLSLTGNLDADRVRFV